jgi:hypothetical protein
VLALKRVTRQKESSDQQAPLKAGTAAVDSSPKPPEQADVALLAGPTADGKGMTVLRAKRGRLEAGEVRPLEPGKPIVGEVVSLKPRKAFPLLCDVETHLDLQPAAAKAKPRESAVEPTARRSGPPQVASEAYRQNWDAIYRRGKKPELLN